MEPEGLGLLSGFVTALGNLAGATEGSPPPEPVVPQPGGAVIELRVSGAEYAISPEDVLAVLPAANVVTGWPQLELTLDDEAAALFTEITTLHQGQQMDLVVCGRVLMSPTIQEPISGGEIVIAGDFTPEETERYANQISGGIPCDATVATK